MNAEFIQGNLVIEHYLMGKLPLREAQELERWCRDNPQAVAELGMADRINSALRLLDAAGETLPWTQAPPAAWQKLPVFAGIAVFAVVALIAAVVLFGANGEKRARIVALERQLQERPLLPLQATNVITLPVSRDGSAAEGSVSIDGSRAELADFRLDVSWSRYNQFVVTIDRLQHGRLAVLSNLARDSNGHLRLGLNTSALGPGDYSVLVEGLDLRRDTQVEGHAGFSVSR